MLLSKVSATAEIDWVRFTDVPISGIANSPYAVKRGGVYVSCAAPELPGLKGVREAIGHGAAAVVIPSDAVLPEEPPLPIAIGRSKNLFATFACLCGTYYGFPHEHLRLVAVTGTKGKSTVCHLLESIFLAAGIRVGVISSIRRTCGSWSVKSRCTTPDAELLQKTLLHMVHLGAELVVIEVSSIALLQERLYGLRFEVVALTNLGIDHVDYHGSMDNYYAAKRRLFSEFVNQSGTGPIAVVNVDHRESESFIRCSLREAITFGRVQGQYCYGRLINALPRITGEINGIQLTSSLCGEHNASNITCAALISQAMGIDPRAISEGVSAMTGIAGRMEEVIERIYIDYAHTPESVRAVLETTRAMYPNFRLISVMGCGGGTTRAKRPLIGRELVLHSDTVIFTSDNPRWEEPVSIVQEMLAGAASLGNIGTTIEIRFDRASAIALAVQIWSTNSRSVVLILGKGNEEYQEIAGRSISYSDRDVVIREHRAACGYVPLS